MGFRINQFGDNLVTLGACFWSHSPWWIWYCLVQIFYAIWAKLHQIQSSISNSLIGDWDQKYGLILHESCVNVMLLLPSKNCISFVLSAKNKLFCNFSLMAGKNNTWHHNAKTMLQHRIFKIVKWEVRARFTQRSFLNYKLAHRFDIELK